MIKIKSLQNKIELTFYPNNKKYHPHNDEELDKLIKKFEKSIIIKVKNSNLESLIKEFDSELRKIKDFYDKHQISEISVADVQFD